MPAHTHITNTLASLFYRWYPVLNHHFVSVWWPLFHVGAIHWGTLSLSFSCCESQESSLECFFYSKIPLIKCLLKVYIERHDIQLFLLFSYLQNNEFGPLHLPMLSQESPLSYQNEPNNSSLFGRHSPLLLLVSLVFK